MRYEYKCDYCGKIKELEHSMKESPEVLCYCNCQVVTVMKKVIHVPTIKFVGSGFYKTDYSGGN
jgi:predicted nucleic acid-binding Zn ribbon protein